MQMCLTPARQRLSGTTARPRKLLPLPLSRAPTCRPGYFITAVRALGLDAGPLWADFEGLYEEFFAGTDEHPILVVNVGYGVPTQYPRDTRFGFDDVTRSL